MLCAVALASLWCVYAAAGEDAPALIYSFDPALSVAAPQSVISSSGAPLIVEKGDQEASVRLQTGGAIAPYLKGEQGPELSAEEQRLLDPEKSGATLPDYQIEAGIGLYVEDKASFSLGYRFNEPPSLLNEQRTDPLSLSGDLRVGFDLKVPFD